MRRVGALPGLWLVFACAGEDATPPRDAGPSSSRDGGTRDAGATHDGGSDDGGTVDGGSDDGGPRDGGTARDGGQVRDGGFPATGWCPDVTLAPASGANVATELSRAHADFLYFSDIVDNIDVGDALSAALAPADALDPAGIPATVARYASVFDEACDGPVGPATLGPATVTLEGNVAVVHPGTGPVQIPAGASAIAIDFTNLPDAPELEDALTTALSAALDSDLMRPRRHVRHFEGLIDYSDIEADADEVVIPTPIVIDGLAAVVRPLGIITGNPMPPLAAELAGALRLEQRAWLFGADVHARVAESYGRRVGDRVLVFRGHMLLINTSVPWPDVIRADYGAADYARLTTLGAPDAPGTEPPRRPRFRPRAWALDSHPTDVNLGTMRAALITAHGTAKLFFPYVDQLSTDLDDVLAQQLATLPGAALDLAAESALYTFTAALQDSRAVMAPGFNPRGIAGSVPLAVLPTGTTSADLGVYASNVPGIDPGDLVQSIGGRSVADLFLDHAPWVSASNDEARRIEQIAFAHRVTGPTPVTVLKPSGAMMTANGDPSVSRPSLPAFPSTGPMTAQGASDVLYLAIDTRDFTWLEQIRGLTSQTWHAVIVDLRRDPGFDYEGYVREILPNPFDVGYVDTPVRSGPDGRSTATYFGDDRPALGQGFTNTYVVIVDAYMSSAAERMASILRASADVDVFIGRPTSASAGDICRVSLPGGPELTLSCTGVRRTDGTPYFGVGITPDIVTYPSPASLQAERLLSIEAALDYVGR